MTKSYSFIFGIFLSLELFAQNESPLNSCREQVLLHCRKEQEGKNVKEVLKCLSKHHDELSTQCKDEIQRLSKVVQQTTPPAGGPLGALGGMMSSANQITMVTYDGSLTPAGDQKEKSPLIHQNNFKFSLPVFKNDSSSVSMNINASKLHFGVPLELDSGVEVPDDFYRISLGLQYSKRLPHKKMFGIQGSYGYAGDEFNSETQSYNVNAHYAFQGSKEGTWVLMLMMSNNGPFGDGVPIPGFFYIYKTEKFTGVFGLPILSIQWTPVAPWSFSFSALGPIIKTEVSYGAIDETQIFSSLAWTQQRFLLAQRENENDRLTLEEKKWEIGLRKPLYRSVYGETSAGYVFDRLIYLGDGLFNRDQGVKNLNSSLYLSWSLRVFF